MSSENTMKITFFLRRKHDANYFLSQHDDNIFMYSRKNIAKILKCWQKMQQNIIISLIQMHLQFEIYNKNLDSL